MGRLVSQMKIFGQSAEHLAKTCKSFAQIPDGDIFRNLSSVTVEIEGLAHGQPTSADFAVLKNRVLSVAAGLASITFPDSLTQKSEHAVRFPGALDVELETESFRSKFSGHGAGLRTGLIFDFKPHIAEELLPIEIDNHFCAVTGTYQIQFSSDPRDPQGVVKLA